MQRAGCCVFSIWFNLGCNILLKDGFYGKQEGRGDGAVSSPCSSQCYLRLVPPPSPSHLLQAVAAPRHELSPTHGPAIQWHSHPIAVKICLARRGDEPCFTEVCDATHCHQVTWCNVSEPGRCWGTNGCRRHSAAQPWGTEMKPVLLFASLPQRAHQNYFLLKQRGIKKQSKRSKT